MKALQIFVPLALALLLALAVGFMLRNPEDIVLPACQSPAPACILTNDVLRDIPALQFDLKRQQFSKQDLPLLNIYLSDGALKKLYRKRRETLDKPGQILVVEDDDWVSARLIADDGATPVAASARLRLKGDWSDHIKHPTKLSFRIKILQQDYIFGMRRFSIQQAKTRKFQAEPLLLNEMRRWGVLAPRYKFVAVRINDYRIGVMALEEHYSKELLEAQQRREGPIVALDEDLLWRQRDLNALGNPDAAPSQPLLQINLKYRDLPVKQFREPDYVAGTTGTNNASRAQSLFRDYMDGRLDPAEVFDLQQLARWWVLTNVWNGCHGMAPHNLRFYFDPTTNLLEPISFDNLPAPVQYLDLDQPCGELPAGYLQGDAEFQNHVLSFAERLLAEYQDPEWRRRFKASQIEMLRVLAMEHHGLTEIYVKDLMSNLARFASLLHFKSIARSTDDSTVDFARRFPDAPLYSHVRAFLYPRAAGMTLELKNLGSRPLLNLQARISDADGERVLVDRPGTLPSYVVGSRQHILTMEIDQPFTAGTIIFVDYQYGDQHHSVAAVVQHRAHQSGFANNFQELLAGTPGITINDSSRNIVLQGADVALRESLELPRGWSVTILPGTRLTLLNGAVLKIRGPLFVQGTAEAPVLINISADRDYRGIGAWGGILVSQAAQRSRVQHAILRGAGEVNLRNRQDYYGITGCLSFYGSAVDIVESSLLDMHCEDALNIVRADFSLRQVTVKRSRADGFDSDFSRGRIEKSLFEHIGNDAVDVSGTALDIEDTHFTNVGDKAVSVGEESELQARRLVIMSAGSGVASKDLSRALVVDSHFRDIRGSGLITYVKKREYGHASIDCQACVFDQATSVATNQQGSQIRINGELLPVTDFNQQQLAEAGFVGVE